VETSYFIEDAFSSVTGPHGSKLTAYSVVCGCDLPLHHIQVA